MMRSPDGARAHGFYLARCEDPKCGVHIVAFDRRDTPFCDIVISLESMPSFINAMQDLAYVKAVERDK